MEFTLKPKQEIAVIDLFRTIESLLPLAPFDVYIDKIEGDLTFRIGTIAGRFEDTPIRKVFSFTYKHGDIYHFISKKGCTAQCRVIQLGKTF